MRLLTLIALVIGCTPCIVIDTGDMAITEVEDTADTDRTVYDMEISAAIYLYAGWADTWIYQVGLTGWAHDVTLSIVRVYETGTWEETHALESYEYAVDGSWDVFFLELYVVETDQVEGLSTLYKPEMEDEMGFEVVATDWYDLDTTDCLVFGAQKSWFDCDIGL